MNAAETSNSGQPTDIGSSNPSQLQNSTGQTRLIVEPIKADITDIKTDIKAIKDNRYADQRYILTVYAAGFLLLAGFTLFIYSKLDDKISGVRDIGIRVDTKLEELLKRIPPVQTPAPKR